MLLQENGDALLTETTDHLLLEGDDMAMTHERAIQLAETLVDISSQLASLHATANQLLAFNSHLNIDWGNAVKPSFLNEDANGNLTGKYYTRQQVADAIGSIQQHDNLMTNQAVSQGNHLGNLNQLARPLG
jgi:hypothetical protein